MDKIILEKTLRQAYISLSPYSNKYTVDFERYLVTLRLLSTIPDVRSKKILDIGTGIGLLPMTLVKLGLSASGMEHYIFPKHDNQMFGLAHIETIKSTWDTEHLTVFDADIFDHDLTRTVGRYDVIISEATIEHVKDPRLFIDQCRSLLNPGGYLLISTPNVSTLLKRFRFLLGKSPYWPIESFLKDGEKFTGHWREYTLKELEYMCRTAGFSIIESRNVNALAKFKSFTDWRKNFRALIVLVSEIVPGSREMNYVLAKCK